MWKRAAVALGVFVTTATLAAQQGQVRRATSISALTAYSGFYNQRPVLVVGSVAQQDNGDRRVSDGTASVRVLFKGTVPDGPVEVRGEFWDIGRMNPSDARLASYDLPATFHIDPDASWPRAGQILAIVASSVTPAASPVGISIRSLVLFPSHYAGDKVTITGQFAGRNLLGELPDAPAKSRYDFVLRSADAAIWVTNLRPRGKDFELSLDTRIDTGRWVEVSGTLQQGRGLQWLDAESGSIKLARAPIETQIEEPIRVAAAPAPEVLFSAPAEAQSDVLLSTSVRIQFSRDIDQATLKNHIHVKYDEKETADRGEPVTPTAEFTTQYNTTGRVLEIRFAGPLERFRKVIVQLDDLILGTDKQPLKAWTLTFDTGGS